MQKETKRRARASLLCGTICLAPYENFKWPLTEFAQGPGFHQDGPDVDQGRALIFPSLILGRLEPTFNGNPIRFFLDT
jgi:hypothetical protein